MATAAAPPAGATGAEIVRWLFERLNEHDVDALRTSCWTPEMVERFPHATYRGPDELAGYFKQLFAALPDFHMDVTTVAEQGEDVFAHWRMTGTHSGAPFLGIAPTGRQVALDGMDHFVVREGTIVSNFVVYDQMQFARQIGFLPEDGTRADRAAKAAFNAKSRLTARLRRI